MQDQQWFDVPDPIRPLERREIPDPTADRKWWRVTITDGTIPAPINVWMTGTDAVRVPEDHLGTFAVVELRKMVAHLDKPELQVKALRALSPIQLRPEGA